MPLWLGQQAWVCVRDADLINPMLRAIWEKVYLFKYFFKTQIALALSHCTPFACFNCENIVLF